MGIKNSIKKWAAIIQQTNWAKNYPLPFVIPVYHSVSDEVLPHLQHIIRYKSVAQFKQDLEEFSQHVEWLDWNEFRKVKEEGWTKSKLPALLTFDDGLSDFYHTVAPILKQKGIYAINFINPRFIDNKTLMFRCKASLLVTEILKNESTFLSKEQILSVKYKDQTILDDWALDLGIDFSQFLKENQPYLNTPQVKNLQSKGFGFAAHGWDHPLYNELTLEEQLSNTQKAMEYCNKNDLLIDAFAFPFTDDQVSLTFFEHLESKNPSIITMGSAGIKHDNAKNNLQRIPMEMNASAEQILKEEVAYYKLKRVVNKNWIKR